MEVSGPQSTKGGIRCQTAVGDRVKTSRNSGLTEKSTMNVPIITGPGGPKQSLRRARIKQMQKSSEIAFKSNEPPMIN